MTVYRIITNKLVSVCTGVLKFRAKQILNKIIEQAQVVFKLDIISNFPSWLHYEWYFYKLVVAFQRYIN